MSKTYIPSDLRRMITEQAKRCCEYCLQPEIFSFCVHEIDHVIAEKHGGLTIVGNLALACKLCNTFKGSDIASIDPETGEIVALYNPRRDRWREHFQIEDAHFAPLTAQARTTVRLLQLNRSDRLSERRAWINLSVSPLLG
jgi:5-methylcytosine-specific restriction endonuclease McrA